MAEKIKVYWTAKDGVGKSSSDFEDKKSADAWVKKHKADGGTVEKITQGEKVIKETEETDE